MSYKEKLKKMQATVAVNMEDYVPGGSGFEAIPDDDYQMRVSIAMDETKEEKKLLAVWKFTVMDGDYEGRSVYSRNTIEDRVGGHICRDRIEKLGFEWPADDLTKLEQLFEEINDASPIVQAKTVSKPQKNNPQYTNTNIYINEVLGAGDDSNGNAEGQAAGEDAAPDETLAAVLDFCSSHGIDGVDETNTVPEIVGAILEAEIKFPVANLSETEITLLGEIGLEKSIEKPVAKKPALKVAAKKK
jgi:hypothetical protein